MVDTNRLPAPLGLLAMIFGLGMILLPTVAFQYLEGWKYRGEARPSVVYSLVLRGAGIILLFLGYKILSHS